jgi:hypothetical protein
MKITDVTSCDRTVLAAFLKDELPEDDRLDFLFHLDTCTRCWEEIYNATKAEHPHFYKRPSRRTRTLDKQMQGVDRNLTEDIFEVA